MIKVKPFKQSKALEKMGPHWIMKKHDNGDLTVRSKGRTWIVTTNGRVFREVK